MKIFIKYSIIALFFLTTDVYSSDEKIGRNFIDLEDIDDGYNIHVMYVIPADGVDKEYDLNSKIGMLLYQVDKWFKKHRPDIVINAAGRVGGILDNYNFQSDYLYVNTMIGMNIVNSSFKYKVKRYIFEPRFLANNDGSSP